MSPGFNLGAGKAVLQLLSDTDAARLMGEAGHRLASSIYSWEAVARVYLKAYEYAVQHASTK